jgi:hypothetical protein
MSLVALSIYIKMFPDKFYETRHSGALSENRKSEELPTSKRSQKAHNAAKNVDALRLLVDYHIVDNHATSKRWVTETVPFHRRCD